MNSLSSSFLNLSWLGVWGLAALIFVARVIDVSMGTIRIVLITRGEKTIAPILGFIEIMIWLLAMSHLVRNLDHWIYYFAFAGGFATGNYAGILLEEKLARGSVVVRTILAQEPGKLIANLTGQGFGVTCADAKGKTGAVYILYMVVPRNQLPEVLKLIEEFNPSAFYSIEDVRQVQKGIFPPPLKPKSLRMIKK